MPKGSLNVSLKGADDIFSTEESRQEQQREQVQQIPIGELFPFKNHPFKVLDDESMQRTVESVLPCEPFHLHPSTHVAATIQIPSESTYFLLLQRYIISPAPSLSGNLDFTRTNRNPLRSCFIKTIPE